MSKGKKYFGILVILLAMAGVAYGYKVIFFDGFGPGLADYEYIIADTCHLSRSSAHQISIFCDDVEGYIQSEVTKVGWDNNFLVAQSNPVTKPDPNNPNCLNCYPDKTTAYWWIVDLIQKDQYGPILSEAEFNKKRTELEIPNLEWLSIEEAKNKGVWIDGYFKQ